MKDCFGRGNWRSVMVPYGYCEYFGCYWSAGADHLTNLWKRSSPMHLDVRMAVEASDQWQYATHYPRKDVELGG